MEGINLDLPIEYLNASLRYFYKNEKHVTRICNDDVLLLVFGGVLRFFEDGKPYEVHEGEYFIQKSGGFQEGRTPSDSPQYLYVHFNSQWCDSGDCLPNSGSFSFEKLKAHIYDMDRLAHGNFNYVQRCEKFYEILTLLNIKNEYDSTAGRIAEYIEREYLNNLSLDAICEQFHFTKNHIINVFKREYGITPVNYINSLKLKRAKYLLEVTSESTESIALKSGFNDYSNFYKLFCRQNGISPAEWRRNNRQ